MDKLTQLKELMMQDRSIRRFDGGLQIGTSVLEQLVDLTRYCASGRNLQPLRYRIVSAPQECSAVYPLLKWAGYLKDWDGPEPEERPTAYLVQCLDTSLTQSCLCDDGLQLQAITLGATSLGLGGCIIKAFNAPAISKVLGLPDNMEPRYVLALGYPKENVVIEPMKSPDEIEYYRTADGVHHVPKRPLSSLLIP